MQFSTTIAASIANILVIFLPMVGVKVGSDQLTVTVQTLVVIFSSLWVWYRRYQQGDVSLAGFKK